MGKKEIDCALTGDYSSVIFYLTEHGWLQPKKGKVQKRLDTEL
jgi:hypothetical protein